MDDQYYDEAVVLIRNMEVVSAGRLQYLLRIGQLQATRIINQLLENKLIESRREVNHVYHIIHDRLPNGKDPCGLFNKYIVQKADGSPVDPFAQYFVLRIDTDVHARAALRAYAHSIRNENPKLASQLDDWLEK